MRKRERVRKRESEKERERVRKRERVREGEKERGVKSFMDSSIACLGSTKSCFFG